jgi:predicted XRE-type DNA-binding protein
MSSTHSRSGRVARRTLTSRPASGGTAKSSRTVSVRKAGVPRIDKGSGNVFADLGFGPAEAENLRLRSHLMIELRNRLGALELTQSEAAQLLHVTQPRISDLMRGKIGRFSVDTLIAMLGRAGMKLSVTVR